MKIAFAKPELPESGSVAVAAMDGRKLGLHAAQVEKLTKGALNRAVGASRFKGGTEAQPLIEALEILRELNATGARNVPDKAPTSFVPARWQGYLDEAAAKGDATA